MNQNGIWQAARRLGAVSLLVVGGVHLREYLDGYAEIETIGPLFLLNFVAAALLAIGLLLPTERLIPRWGSVLVRLLALGGIGLSGVSLAMLTIAERGPLFGFMEPGFHPEMLQLSRVSETATGVLLGAFLFAQLAGGRPGSGADVGDKYTDENSKELTPVGNRNRMVSRLAVPGLLAVVALVAACGGGDGGSTAASTTDDAVSTAEVDGRSVLVTAEGLPLYFSDEEQASGDVLCVSDGCLAFWEPLTTDTDTPSGDVDGAELGVVARPDGANQVTLDGAPLYTFAEDSSGEINGDGLSDTFDGQTLTWRVAAAAGSSGAPSDEGGDPYDY